MAERPPENRFADLPAPYAEELGVILRHHRTLSGSLTPDHHHFQTLQTRPYR